MRLHHIALRTANPNALAAFYVEAFGLVITARHPHSLWLGLGPARLMIEQAGAEEPPVAPATMEMFALQIDPSERAVIDARLARLGVEIESQTEHTLYLRDLDGRRVGVSSYPFDD